MIKTCIAAVIVVGGGSVSAHAQECDPAKILVADKTIAFSKDDLAIAWAVSEYTSTESSKEQGGSITVPVYGVPVTLGYKGKSALAKQMNKKANYRLNNSSSRYLMTQKLSGEALAAYQACLRNRGGFHLSIAGAPERRELSARIEFIGGLPPGTTVNLMVTNGTPVFGGSVVRGRGDTKNITLPLGGGSNQSLQIVGRNVTKPTLVTANLAYRGGDGSGASESIEIPPAIDVHLRYVKKVGPLLKAQNEYGDPVVKAACVGIADSDKEGFMAPEMLSWESASTNSPGRGTFHLDADRSSDLQVCASVKANGRAGLPITVRGKPVAYAVVIEKNKAVDVE